MIGKINKSKNINVPKKYFLEDKPLENLSEDKFQYTQVAEILFDLLQQNNFPTNIGLFAPWGSGKTSVIKLLKQLIEANKKKNEQYIVKIISVWKFADDAPSLHRKIVREIQAELNVIDEEGLDKESTRTESSSGTGIFSILIFNKFFRYSFIGFILILILSIFLASFYPSLSTLMSGLITLSIIPPVISVMKLFMGNFQRGTQVSTKSIFMTHGDQYEVRFKASVDKYLKKKHGQNLVLIFDDMDRLPPAQMLAALNTIKTFLNSNHCAFIIPCDERILREGIKTAFEQKDIIDDSNSSNKNDYTTAHYVSEFINKTFDYQIHLPILEQKNMKRYAKSLLVDQQIAWKEDPDINIDKVLGVLVHTSIKTPRQVKALLNAFSSNWMLAKKRDQETGSKLLSANPLAIAVFTVLQTDFPDYYLRLVSDPFIITHKEDNQDTLLAGYLARVDKCIPKSDPRPFIYFSNEKLNPATGKPKVIRVKDYLLNGQVTEFKNSFSDLDIKDREILLSSVISDFDDNPGIEVENTIKTLIESQVDLSAISEMDLHNWDLLIRDNQNSLSDYPPSKVCNLLNFVSYDNRTWHQYGSHIEVSRHFEDLLKLWISNPDFIDRLNILQLASQVEDAYISNDDGYSLISIILDLHDQHSIINDIDWLRVLHESLETNVEPDFTLSSWLETWSAKTQQLVSTELVNQLLTVYDFKTMKFLDGIGVIWCDKFIGNDEDLAGLIALMKHDSFDGFSDEDYSKINTFMQDSNYNNIRDVVRPMLDEWWDEGEYEKLAGYLKKFSESPGAPGFCEKHFSFDLNENMQELFLETIIRRGKTLNNKIKNVLSILQEEFTQSGTNRVSSKSIKVIKRLLQSPIFHGILIDNRESFLSIADNMSWLNWNESMVSDRLEIFFDLWAGDKEADDWIFDCVNILANCAAGKIYTGGYTFGGQATTYLNLFTEKLCEKYVELDWDEIVENWTEIPSNNHLTTDLFTLLDVTSRSILIGQLSLKCKISNEIFNKLLHEYYDSSLMSHRKAIFARWEALGTDIRKLQLENLFTDEVEVNTSAMDFLETHLKTNPQDIYLDEFVEFEFEDSYRHKLLGILINKLPRENVIAWVNDSIAIMNDSGFHKWRAEAIELAMKEQKVNTRGAESIIETSLGLGNDRARIALKMILASDYSKLEMKKFREKIISLHNQFPEYVDQFGFRFKINKV